MEGGGGSGVEVLEGFGSGVVITLGGVELDGVIDKINQVRVFGKYLVVIWQ